MNIIQNIIALIFLAAFLILIFFIAWYIALPLLLIGLVLNFFGIFNKQKYNENNDVIDADYREIK